MTLHRHEMPMMMLFDDDRLFGLRRRDTRNDHADRRQRSNRKNEFLHHCLLEDANGPTTTRIGETRSLPMRRGAWNAVLLLRSCCTAEQGQARRHRRRACIDMLAARGTLDRKSVV